MTTVPASALSPAVPVYVAVPRGTGPFPAVLFLHGCNGFSGFDAVAADRLAAKGYVGVALDALGPDEPHGACTDPSGARKEAGAARSTLAWLRTQSYVNADRLGIIGFSMGGIAALDLIDPIGAAVAAPDGLRIVVAYYPACDGRDGNVTVPLAIFDGDADKFTPAPPCAALVQAATAAGKTAQITTYPGATHAFNLPVPEFTFFGQTIRFDASATEDAAQKSLLLLAKYLK
jgi:dienelactone hydrolase